MILWMCLWSLVYYDLTVSATLSHIQTEVQQISKMVLSYSRTKSMVYYFNIEVLVPTVWLYNAWNIGPVKERE